MRIVRYVCVLFALAWLPGAASTANASFLTGGKWVAPDGCTRSYYSEDPQGHGWYTFATPDGSVTIVGEYRLEIIPPVIAGVANFRLHWKDQTRGRGMHAGRAFLLSPTLIMVDGQIWIRR